MSYPINQKIPPYQQNQPAMGLNVPQNIQQQPTMGITTPQLQNVSADSVAQGITQNSVLKTVSNDDGKNPWLAPLLTIPVGTGMVYGMDKFNKACKTDKEGNNLIKRIADKGDWVSEKLPFVDKMASKINDGVKYLDNKVVAKSSMLSAFSHGPSQAESHMVLTMAGGSKSEIAADAISKLQQHLELGNTLIGTDKAELDDLAKKAHTPKGIERIVEICRDQGIGETASTEARQFLNLRNIPFIGKKLFQQDKYLSDTIKPLQSLGRKVYFSEYVNKIEAFTAPQGKTALGRLFPKATIRGLEGLTNGTAGGKIAVLLGAYFVAEAMKKGIDAPKGEKVKTFTENLFYNSGWYLTMPLGLGIMHKLGGLQYTGMGKGQNAKGENIIENNLKDYREKLAEFNKNAKEGNFKTKDAYKEAEKVLDKLKSGDGRAEFSKPKTWYKAIYKPIRGIAKLLTVGLETRRPYIENVNPTTFMEKVGKFAKNLPYNLKNGAGYPMRFGVFMFLIAPPLAKVAAQVSHVFFGKPTKSVLDEGEESEKEKQQPELIMPQQNQPQVVGQAPVAQQNTTPNSTQGPIQGQVQIQPQVQQPTSVMQYTTVQNNQNLIDDKSAQQPQKTVVANQTPVRRYMPSSEPVRLDPNRNNAKDDKVEALINKSKYAVSGANKYLPEGKQDKEY